MRHGGLAIIHIGLLETENKEVYKLENSTKSIFKNGNGTITKAQFTKAWIQMINKIEKSKSAVQSDQWRWERLMLVEHSLPTSDNDVAVDTYSGVDLKIRKQAFWNCWSVYDSHAPTIMITAPNMKFIQPHITKSVKAPVSDIRAKKPPKK